VTCNEEYRTQLVLLQTFQNMIQYPDGIFAYEIFNIKSQKESVKGFLTYTVVLELDDHFQVHTHVLSPVCIVVIVLPDKFPDYQRPISRQLDQAQLRALTRLLTQIVS
jgi:hypothetical protein